jgi:hypothetical protein
MSIGPDDPLGSVVETGYRYWQPEYTVLAFIDFNDSRGKSIPVRWREPTHGTRRPVFTCTRSRRAPRTAWERGWDRVLGGDPGYECPGLAVQV